MRLRSRIEKPSCFFSRSAVSRQRHRLAGFRVLTPAEMRRDPVVGDAVSVHLAGLRARPVHESYCTAIEQISRLVFPRLSHPIDDDRERRRFEGTGILGSKQGFEGMVFVVRGAPFDPFFGSTQILQSKASITTQGDR